VTGLSTMAPYPRTPQAVVAAWLQDPDGRVPGARPVPVGKELRATWEGKAVALARLVTRAAPRGSALHVMLFLENTLQALFIFNGLRSRHCQRALLGYHYLRPLWNFARLGCLSAQHPTIFVETRELPLLARG
jgi:hypothetical protein